MTTLRFTTAFRRFLRGNGMLQALLVLCVYYSIATLETQYPVGAEAGEQLARAVRRRLPPQARVLAVLQDTREDVALASALEKGLEGSGHELTLVQGEPADARQTLQAAVDAGKTPNALVCTSVTADWNLIADRATVFPSITDAPVLVPESYTWPVFLNPGNLLNIPNQVAVISILAAGMTLVVLTGGIDLSVGSVVALSAVTATLLIRDAGGIAATPGVVIACCMAAVLACTLVGLFSGLFIVTFDHPSFIVTLAVMSMGSGLAYELSKNHTIDQVPANFQWLGVGADLLGIPNAVILALLIYAAVHVLLTRMTLGRYIYAVGGNAEAARLSGVPVRRVLLFCYAACAGLAGLGGVVLSSQLSSGAANYGQNYELNAIAAVAVGGTSLRGGQGSVLGTLAGALILGVINNGMNLTNVSGNMQRIVLGAVILGAVTLESVKQRGIAWLWKR